jgi:hypothetical protein
VLFRRLSVWWRSGLGGSGEKVGGGSGLEGSRRESGRVCSCARSGLALLELDWMVREVDATTVTSVQCQIAEPKSRTCAFDKDQALRFPSHVRARFMNGGLHAWSMSTLGEALFGDERSTCVYMHASIRRRRLNPQPTAAVDLLRTTHGYSL